MKTPREILLSKHQSVMPKLDAIRQEAVGKVADEKPKRVPMSYDRHQYWRVLLAPSPIGWERAGVRALFIQIWLELILPCRRIWGGLAAVWVGIIIFNLSQSSSRPPVMANAPSAAESAAAYHDQQRVLNELLADRSVPMEAVRPRSYAPKPSSKAGASWHSPQSTSFRSLQSSSSV